MEQKQIWNKHGFRQVSLQVGFMGSSEEEDLGGGKDVCDEPYEQEENYFSLSTR